MREVFIQANTSLREVLVQTVSTLSQRQSGRPVLVGHADNAQVLNTGHVATQFLTSKEGRDWDGTGRKWWYRNGLGTIVDFTRGPDVS